jgi:tetratricopeptide (TPR) repeat protein
MKTKEIAFTLPVIILLYETVFFGWPGRKLIAQMTPLLLTIAIIPYTVYSTVNPLLQPGGSLLSDVTSPAYSIARVTRWEYLYTQFSVILTYLRLLILPINQNLDYDFPMNLTLTAPRTILSLLALLLLFSLAVYLLMKSNRNASSTRDEERDSQPAEHTIPTAPLYRLAAFGIFWFFITLSVESSIIQIQDVIFEHRLYLPSFGFFLSVVSFTAVGLDRLSSKIRDIRSVATSAVVILVLTLSSATFARNNTWHDWPTIWGDTVKKSPNKPRPHLILGIGYYYRQEMDKALQEYQRAASLKLDYCEAYYNMGLVYKARQQHAEAIPMYLKVLNLSALNAEMYAKVFNEIGTSYADLGDYDQAVKALTDAVKYQPESVEFRNNYAFALRTSGNLQAALKEYQTALSLDPDNEYAQIAIKEIETEKEWGGKSPPLPAP